MNHPTNQPAMFDNTIKRSTASASRTKKAILVAGVATAFWPSSVQAQTVLAVSPVPTAGAVSQQQTAEVTAEPVISDAGDIVVTAQRRTERLVDVPMSISVVSGQEVAKAGVVSVHDMANVVSGVQFGFSGCCTQPAVRGISTLTTGIGYENNVALYVDGFYTPDNVTINGDLANIANIQVLKGPQGTLYGRNATGGAILINTLAPSKTFTGKFSAGYARFNELSLSGYVSGPVANRTRLGVAAYRRKSDGYHWTLDEAGNRINRKAGPMHQVSVRTKLESDLSDDLVATLAYNYGLSSDPRGDFFKYVGFVSAALPPSPPRASKPFDISNNRDTVVKGTTHEGTLKLAHELGVGSLTSYTGYAKRHQVQIYDFDGSYRDLQGSDQNWYEDTFQQSFDLNITSINKLDLVIGGNYYYDSIKTDDNTTFVNFLTTSILQTKIKTNSFAIYVDGSYQITDAITLSGGARYSTEKKEGSYRNLNGAGAVTIDVANEATFKALTPHASIRFEIAPRTNVYATIARGFRTGGFPPGGAANLALYQPFLPEEITSYEVGFKTSSRIVQFSTAAFYYDYTNLQVGVRVPNPNGTATFVTAVRNAKKAEVYGIDGDLYILPIPGLNVRLGGAYLHARYKDFPNANGNGLNIATNLNVPNQSQNWSGTEMARAPGFSAIVAADYTIESFIGGSLNVGVNTRYTESYVVNNASLYGPLAGALAEKQRYRQGAYAIVNLQANWTDPSGQYQVGLFGNNVTNALFRLTYNGGALGDYSSFAAPASYGVRFGYNF